MNAFALTSSLQTIMMVLLWRDSMESTLGEVIIEVVVESLIGADVKVVGYSVLPAPL
jgi:hypothetical protein